MIRLSKKYSNTATLTISNQPGITLNEGHDLSLFVAAYLLYRTFNDSNKHHKTWIDKNINKLLPLCKEYLGTLDKKFIYDLQPIKKNIILNIYFNICWDVRLQNQLQNLVDINKITFKCIDLTSNLVPEITETNRKICAKCNSELKRKNRYMPNAKGSIAIIYTNKRGPILTVHYMQQCTNTKCNALYYHGRYETSEGIYLESIENTYQMNTKSTFFDDNCISEVNSFNLDDGTRVQSYTEKYHARFSEEFEEIELTFAFLQQTLGNRKSFDAKLQNQRVLDGVCTRRLQTRIEQKLGKQIFISWDQITKYKQQQEKIILKPSDGSEKVLKKTWIDCRDMFNLMYDKYFEQLSKTTDKWLQYVPVKDGQILLKHFLLMGDGGQGLTHPICGYPMSLYQHELGSPTNETEKQFWKFLRCCASPQQGNDHSKSIVTCINHTKHLRSLSLPLTLINDFCKFINTKNRLVSIPATNKHEKVIEKLEKQIEKYNKNAKTFTDISNKILNITRKSPRNLDTTYANMNESQQYLQDEQILSDLEQIYRSNNLNPSLLSNLSNPQLSKLIESERNNINVWNQLDGCRKGYHVIDHQESDPLYTRTGGLQNWMSHDGFILYLGENVHRETPTEVLIGLGTVLTATDDHIEYSKRIMGVGYDMMCCLYGRLRTLIELAYLPPLIISLFISLLAYLFIDLFHIKTHKNPLCSLTGLFHPQGKKFKKQRIETGGNDSIVEQNWKVTNSLKFAKNLGQRRFSFMLYDFKERHNEKNWNKLVQKGYEFIPISDTTIIRDFTNLNSILPSTNDLLNKRQYQTLKIVQLKKSIKKKQKRKNVSAFAPTSKKRKLQT